MCCNYDSLQCILLEFSSVYDVVIFSGKSRDLERQREIAALEAQLYRFSEVLGEQRAATRENVQRKQAQTGEERDESDDGKASLLCGVVYGFSHVWASEKAFLMCGGV